MIDLYDHNLIAFKNLLAVLDKENGAAIIQPTGTGKSYIIAKLLDHFKDKSFLILTGNNYIINQFQSNFKFPNVDYSIFSYSSLLSESIFDLIKEKQSIDFILLDEFHRAGAEHWGTRVHSLYELFPEAKKIGLTATRKRTGEEDRDLISEFFFGNIANELTLIECFEKEILPTPKYVSAIYNLDEEYNKLIDKTKASTISNKDEIRKRIIEYKLKWEKGSGASAILNKHITTERNFSVFCKDIAHLEKMIPIVSSWFKSFSTEINVFKVYSSHTNSEAELEMFIRGCSIQSDSFNLLFSVQQLNEGIHVPNIEGVIFLRPTESHIVYYQQLGRCLESKGKNPIVFDMVNNFKKRHVHEQILEDHIEDSFNRSKYEKATDIDEIFSFEIIDEIQSARKVFEEYEKELSSWNEIYDSLKTACLENEGYELTRQQRAWVSYQAKTVSDLSSSRYHKMEELTNIIGYDWKNTKYFQTKAWMERYDSCFSELQLKQKLVYCSLGTRRFISTNRALFNREGYDALGLEKINLLDKLNHLLNANWRDMPIPHWWRKQYYEIKAQFEKGVEYGNLTKIQRQFLINQRIRQSENNFPREVKLLNYLSQFLSFDWRTPFGLKNKAWYDNLNAARKDIEKNRDYHKTSIKTRKFLYHNRSNINANKSNGAYYTKDKLEALDKLGKIMGIDWRKKPIDKRDGQWLNNYNKAKADLIKNGFYKSNSKTKQFLSDQRRYIKLKGKLPKSKIRKLDLLNEYIDFDWRSTDKPYTKIWINSYEAVKEEILRVSKYSNYSSRTKSFLKNQRKQYHAKSLSNGKYLLLEKLEVHLELDWKEYMIGDKSN